MLDRNGDGIVNSGNELFGNVTTQPTPPEGQERNGFLALAVFDTPTQGGNGDGTITPMDSVFSRLRLWRDANHDGVSQPYELRTLEAAGITKISLRYTESRRTDEFGNQFRFKGKALITDPARRSEPSPRDVIDVFLTLK